MITCILYSRYDKYTHECLIPNCLIGNRADIAKSLSSLFDSLFKSFFDQVKLLLLSNSFDLCSVLPCYILYIYTCICIVSHIYTYCLTFLLEFDIKSRFLVVKIMSTKKEKLFTRIREAKKRLQLERQEYIKATTGRVGAIEKKERFFEKIRIAKAKTKNQS